MKKFFAAMTAALLMVALASTVALAAPSKTTLKTFGTGDVTLGTVGGASATIVNDTGEYGGVYIQSKSQSSKLLANAVFQFTSRGDIQGGAPRFSLPINDGAFDPNTDYAFLDAANCGGTVGPGTSTVLVSTQNPVCGVFFGGVMYANWTVFAQTNPTYKLASGQTPFIIADVAGTYVVTDIVLR